MPTDTEREAALVAAKIDWQRPVIIEIDLTHMIGIIGLLQLALRHPEARKRPTAKMVERFVLNLIEQIDPEHGETWKLLQRGFNPNWDM